MAEKKPIAFDSWFDDDHMLDKLSNPYTGWRVTFDPRQGVAIVDVEPRMNSGVSEDLFHNRKLVLWSTDKTLAKAGFIRDYLVDCIDRLQDLAAGHEVEWNGQNHVGSLTAEAADLRDALYWELEDRFKDDPSVPTYWNAEDWFNPSPPDPYESAESLVEEARKEGIYLDQDDVEAYLASLKEEAAAVS